MRHMTREPRHLILSLCCMWACIIGWLPTMVCAETDSRVRLVQYDANAVVPIVAFMGYHIHFAFAPDEYFTTLGAGNTAALDVASEGNHLLLKPKQAMNGTNLTLITTKHVYYLDFKVLARAPKPSEAVYSVVFQYPSAPIALGEDHSRDASITLNTLPAISNRDYWYCGSPELRPVSAVDDGTQMRLTFAPQAEIPALYIHNPDGSESLVNSHVEEDTVIIHHLAAQLVLRRGPLVGCVVNKADTPPQQRAVSGTLLHAIKRVVIGAST